MKLSYIELAKLIISPSNMRAKHKRRDIQDLIPSVRARGVLVPILVRPNGEPGVFEIVAGRRRFMAAKAVADDGGGITELPCAIMEAGDDAGALEASLIENVARLDADEVTQWETFVRLIREGKTAEDIAATFGLPQRMVERVLALGNLVPRIRALYRAGQIDVTTVRHLTMASTAQQREWLTLVDSEDRRAPTGRLLKEWLFGGTAIRTSTALFDLEDYTAPIISDLFSDDSYFSDGALFWQLQNKAIDAKREAYREDGWSDVIVLELGEQFRSWEHDRRPRDKKGRVYLAVSSQGVVEAHEGYLPRKESLRLDREIESEAPKQRTELTAPLRRYVELHRHLMVRHLLLSRPMLALRFILAHAITSSSLWSIGCENQQTDKPDTETSITNSPAQATFLERRIWAYEMLGLDLGRRSLTGVYDAANFSEIAKRLVDLPDNDVLEIGAIVMGDSLQSGSGAVDALGELVTPDAGEMWLADEAFLALVRDRKVLLALLEEVAGTDVAHANGDASAKILRTILHDCLQGTNGRTQVLGWAPRWLRFPATSYLAGPSADEDAERNEDGDLVDLPENADTA
ncbi:ParB/RepB/Spo0J family partition protein [Sphingomonas sp. AOB5]|uniref:ParB/RepB/Spo0J family partition protein n=1 Tax=Sphingomonas sp. AOB5 TaxID=3034017 RepID=UPI0023FA1CF6|nr:ParB/RepB/Spo0J family partition protein [Sphingomonas sp. AOB5]MDF7774293.1 ParB/RepB/Spo0J family partition protein [Sphingomonas sp. AOB5]